LERSVRRKGMEVCEGEAEAANVYARGMAFRERWRNVKPLDRALVAMVLLAGISLFGVYLRSLPRVHTITPAESAALVQGVPDQVASDSPGRRVLVIMNLNDPESMHIGVYYAKKRGVPRANLVLLRSPSVEEIDRPTYKTAILAPVREALAATKNPADFMLFTHGVPMRIAEDGRSVDGEVATESAAAKTTAHRGGNVPFYFIDNPYFNQHEPFTRAKYGFCLACRLDGYTEADALGMIDRGLAAKPLKGPFLLDGSNAKSGQGYEELNVDLGAAARALQASEAW